VISIDELTGLESRLMKMRISRIRASKDWSVAGDNSSQLLPAIYILICEWTPEEKPAIFYLSDCF
jgi:hypothetical protein